jgi:uncharacterized membrane protein
MTQNKSLHQNATLLSHSLLVLSAIGMVVLSLYLTNHYFDVHFPTGLESASVCDINSFFNCDTATLSSFSNIMGVPISALGLITGVFVLLGYLFQAPQIERTNFFMLAVNLVGCIVLFIYSLAVLGSLCPFCTLYYILSAIAFFIFWKNSELGAPDFKVLAVYGAVFGITFFLTKGYVDKKVEKKAYAKRGLVTAFQGLRDIGKPAVDSPYRVASATENFSDAPLQMTVYSDFQCPGCKALSDRLHSLKDKYKGKINIQYMFYPLDMNCNPKMQYALHPLACKAAYLASCLPGKFLKVHDDIFDNQGSLTNSWLDDYAKRENVTECMNSEETKKKVTEMIKAAEVFNISSTPTSIINGRKITGVRSDDDFNIIMDYLLEQNGKK